MSGVHVIRLGCSDSWNTTIIDLFGVPMIQGEILKNIVIRTFKNSYSIKNVFFQSTYIGADLLDINSIINYIKNNNTVIVPYRENGYFSNLYKTLCASNNSNCDVIANSINLLKM
jgi:hypothetical protein